MTMTLNTSQRPAAMATVNDRHPIQRRGPPEAMPDLSEASLPRWLSVDQIRKMQRMRRETVLTAMQTGELPFEQRGRIRYARMTDVLAWEQRRLKSPAEPVRTLVHPDLIQFA